MTTVATSLPSSDGEPNDVSPRNFFNHSLKSLLDLHIGSCVCQPFIRSFLYECSNRVSNRGQNSSVPVHPFHLQPGTESVLRKLWVITEPTEKSERRPLLSMDGSM